MSVLEGRVSVLETQLEATQAVLHETALLQQRNSEAIAKNETMLIEVLRVMRDLGSRSKRNEGGIGTLHDAVGRLTRAADADRQEMRNVTNELSSMTSRLDALVNHLMSQSSD